MKSLLFSLFLVNSFNIFAGDTDTVRAGYIDSVKIVLKNIQATKDSQVIEYCIPTTTAESRLYFSLNYEKEFSPGFQELQKKIVRSSISGNTKLLRKYLYLSEFVDGYFAEDYFVAVEKIARSNIVSFCNVLADCDKQKIERLKEVRLKYCK